MRNIGPDSPQAGGKKQSVLGVVRPSEELPIQPIDVKGGRRNWGV
jgi:hypothetical protein